MNDAEMLSMAGKGCIMEGAHQRLKDLHPELEVIGSNADDAVPLPASAVPGLNIDGWLLSGQLSTNISAAECSSSYETFIVASG